MYGDGYQGCEMMVEEMLSWIRPNLLTQVHYTETLHLMLQLGGVRKGSSLEVPL